MRQATFLAIAMLLCTSWAYAQAGGKETLNVTPQMTAVAEGGNEFAFDLYARLSAAQKGNLFFSPSSIHTALAMTYAGAAGNTADQQAKTMRYSMPPDKLAAALGDLLKLLNTPHLTYERKPAYELVVSNALWPATGYPFKPAYVELVKKDFGASLQELDYAGQAEAARKTINDAIARQTKDKIKDLVPPSAVTDLTRLILTNAIYFKSNWMDKFVKEATAEAPFKLSAEKTANCPMMHRQGHYSYGEAEDLQVLEMPYMYRDLSMILLLPKKVDGLAELEKKLSAKQLAQWLGQGKAAMVKVSLPRFKFSGEFSLGDTLKAMGMTDAFSAQAADFSGMTTAEKLAISAVIHKSFVAVDEEGTEAAAATAVMMVGSAAPRPEEVKVFNADHPFVFLIRHNATGAILFAGRLSAPEGGEDAAKASAGAAENPTARPRQAPLPQNDPFSPGGTAFPGPWGPQAGCA